MANDQIYHVKLHEGSNKWFSLVWPLAMILIFGYLVFSLDVFSPEDNAPFRVDLSQYEDTAELEIGSKLAPESSDQ